MFSDNCCALLSARLLQTCTEIVTKHALEFLDISYNRGFMVDFHPIPICFLHSTFISFNFYQTILMSSIKQKLTLHVYRGYVMII